MELVPWTYNNPRVDRQKLDKQEFLFQGHLLQILQDTNIEIDVNKNTAFKLWDGAFLLARHLENKSLFPCGFWDNKKCIEIGAGCGLVGQVAWMLGADVTLTDLEVALPHTKKCLNVNQASLVNRPDIDSNKIKALPYSWGEGTSDLQTPYNVIFGSDVIYQAKLAKYIVRALEELSGPDTLILISYKPRGLGEHVTFDLMKRHGFVIASVDKANHPMDFQDSDYELLHITHP